MEQQKAKPNFSLSNIEVEYMVVTHTMKETLWFWTFNINLKETWTNSTIIYCENQSAIALTLNLKYHARTKHIEIYYYFVREKVASKDVMLQYYQIEEMIVAVFTKRLPKEKHH